MHPLAPYFMKFIDAGELLHAAAIEDFGSWETAREYCLVRAREVGRSRELTPERTAQQLRRLCATGHDSE